MNIQKPSLQGDTINMIDSYSNTATSITGGIKNNNIKNQHHHQNQQSYISILKNLGSQALKYFTPTFQSPYSSPTIQDILDYNHINNIIDIDINNNSIIEIQDQVVQQQQQKQDNNNFITSPQSNNTTPSPKSIEILKSREMEIINPHSNIEINNIHTSYLHQGTPRNKYVDYNNINVNAANNNIIQHHVVPAAKIVTDNTTHALHNNQQLHNNNYNNDQLVPPLKKSNNHIKTSNSNIQETFETMPIYHNNNNINIKSSNNNINNNNVYNNNSNQDIKEMIIIPTHYSFYIYKVLSWLVCHDSSYLIEKYSSDTYDLIKYSLESGKSILSAHEIPLSAFPVVIYLADKFVRKCGINHKQIFNLILISSILCVKFMGETVKVDYNVISKYFSFTNKQLCDLEKLFLRGLDFELYVHNHQIKSFLEGIEKEKQHFVAHNIIITDI